MGLYDYWIIVRSRLHVLAAVVVLTVGSAVAFSARATPVYSSRATVYFSSPSGQSNRDLSRGLLYAQTLVRSYAEAATEPLVMDAVIRQLGLDMSAKELADTVDVLAPLGTVTVQVRATDTSAQRSAVIANAVARQLAASVDKLTPRTPLRAPPVRVSTVAEARVPESPSSPRSTLNVALAVLLGTLAGVVLAVWLDGVDPRVSSRRDVAAVTRVPVIGSLPRNRRRWVPWRRAARHRFLLEQLHVNFRGLQDEHRLHSALFLSPTDEGVPVRAMSELGASLTNDGARVLLIDADLRPLQNEPASGERGLASVLRGEMDWREGVTASTGEPSVLAAGGSLDDPGAALGSPVMAGLLHDLQEHYDVVLIQAAPVLRAADGLSLSTLVDGVVLLADHARMRRRRFERAVRALTMVKAPLRGVVLGA